MIPATIFTRGVLGAAEIVAFDALKTKSAAPKLFDHR